MDPFKAIAAKHAGSYPVQMGVGQALAAAGAREDAVAAFERGAELVPSAVGPSSPRAQIAALAERAGDFPRALRELKGLLGDDHTHRRRAAARPGQAPGDERLALHEPIVRWTRSIRHARHGRLARAARLALAARGSGGRCRSSHSFSR
jgi:hypothetical protein